MTRGTREVVAAPICGTRFPRPLWVTEPGPDAYRAAAAYLARNGVAYLLELDLLAYDPEPEAPYESIEVTQGSCQRSPRTTQRIG